LNNKADHIELRYPDGKQADNVKYKKDKIEDDEAYVKEGKKWDWIKMQIEVPEIIPEEILESNPAAEDVSDSDIIENVEEVSDGINNTDGENQSLLYPQKNNMFMFASPSAPIRFASSNNFGQGKVLGVEITDNGGQRYVFTQGQELENNGTWSSSLFLIINSAINRIVNLI
jgi:hypothetical protein